MLIMHRMTYFVLIGLSALYIGCQRHREAVTTYHYDNLRTGWNAHETVLTPANVQSSKFGLLHSVVLDDQVDAQPLVVPRVQITAGADQERHDIVYVATEADSIYAINAETGDVLFRKNFGAAVPAYMLPGACGNNGPAVGISGTPVIDPASQTMYVVIYTLENSGPTYRIHALDLGNLNDKVAPVVVTGSHMLTNGMTFDFDARYARQRPALLLANGNVYAGFGSFCDIRADVSRGWILGWRTGTLAALPANQLNDLEATSGFYLSSVWMSGYGIAADSSGSLYFTTGNSATGTYDGSTNIQESVVKVSPDLTSFTLFTPSNVNSLDAVDFDYGSGGVLLLPDQLPPKPRLAAAAGKQGDMYVLDRDVMGGPSPHGQSVTMVNIDQCWCGQSYFDGRVVSSGGSIVRVWKLLTSPSVALNLEASSASLSSGQDGGFFTSISSNGTANAVIWAVSRPTNVVPGDVSLYAFNAVPSASSVLTTQFHGAAGSWPYVGGNANIVPVVANGKVYVASYRQLAIFGLH
jgi:hypothetical protein